MKHRFYVWVLTLIMMAGFLTIPSMAAEVSFSDTSGHWAEEAIGSVVEKGLFNGTSETSFSPDVSMDRGMFVTVLGRFAEKMGFEVKGGSTFDDVSQTAYYAQYVAWAADQGIVKGTSETTFSPTQPVTREQMCALFLRLLNYAKYEIPDGTDVSFVDRDKISDYAKENVQSAVALGLIKGIETAEGMAFCPLDSATRAQVATVFLRLDGLEGIYDVNQPVAPVDVDPTPDDPQPSDPSPGGTTPDDPQPSNPSPGGTTPVNPQPSNPSPGGSTPVNPQPSNPTPGGTTPDDPQPSDPTPVDPTPVTPGPEPTEEDKIKEAEVAGYMSTMLDNYSKLGAVSKADTEVQQCLKIITDSMSDALNNRANGAFISKDYVEKTYSSEITRAKDMYYAMSEEQQAQMQNIILQMEKLSNLMIVMDYFGINISY